MAIQLTLLLISCSLYSMYFSSFSSSLISTPSSLALLVLVLSTFFSLLFSNFRQVPKPENRKACNPLPSMEEEEAVVHQEKNIVLPQDDFSEEIALPEDLTGDHSESTDCREEESNDNNDDDDESLIEISLVDGHYVEKEEDEQNLLAEFLPDFMDILSEISEEENLIEIDIARGSIKCSSFSIKA